MTAMPPILSTAAAFAIRHDVAIAIVAGASAASAAIIFRTRARHAVGRRTSTGLALSFISATLATAVAASGMWQFFGDRLHVDAAARVLFFSFMEIAVLNCASLVRQRIRKAIAQAKTLRAEGKQPPLFSAGSPGVMIWVVAALSGVFSALGAHSVAEAVFRLAPAPIAAWLWEQALYGELRDAGLTTRFQLVASRLLVRLGIAEAEHRNTGEAAAQWYLMRLARAVVRARRSSRLRNFWEWRARSLTALANERADLAGSEDRQDLLLAYIGALLGVGELVTLEPPAPWASAAAKRAWKRLQDGPGPGSQDGSVPALTVSQDGPRPVSGDGSGPSRPGPEDGSGDEPEDGSGDGTQDGPEDGSGDGAKPSRRPAFRLRPGHGKKAPALVPHVLAMIAEHGRDNVSRDRVKDDLHVGSTTAKTALELADARLADGLPPEWWYDQPDPPAPLQVVRN